MLGSDCNHIDSIEYKENEQKYWSDWCPYCSLNSLTPLPLAIFTDNRGQWADEDDYFCVKCNRILTKDSDGILISAKTMGTTSKATPFFLRQPKKSKKEKVIRSFLIRRSNING